MPKQDTVSRETMGYGKRLYDSRKAAGDQRKEISQVQAGRFVGRKGATVGRWETEELQPDLWLIVGLAKLYGVDPAWLAFGTEEERAALLGRYQPPEKPKPVSSAERAARAASKHKDAAGRKPSPRKKAL